MKTHEMTLVGVPADINDINEVLDKLGLNRETRPLEWLQLVEVGLVGCIPEGILCVDAEVMPANWHIWDKNISEKPDFNKCVSCGYDLYVITHHVYFNKKRVATSGSNGIKNTEDFIYLGRVRICPNCHALIHQANPFTVIKRPDLYI